MRRRTYRALAAGVTALLLTALAMPAYAALTTNAPTLAMHEARAYRNVVESGDLLVIARYSLPEVSWATHGADAAIARLEQGSTLHQSRTPHTIGESITGFYLEPGHSFTWTGSTSTADLQSNPSLFENNTSSSVSLTFVGDNGSNVIFGGSQANQDVLCNGFQTLLTNVEAADSGDDIESQDFVDGGGVTEAGTAVALQAFSAATSVLPDCFSAGISPVMDDFDPENDALKDDRVTRVEATDFWGHWDALAAQWGWEDEGIAAALIGTGIAGAIMVLSMVLFQAPMYGATAGALMLLAIAVNAPHYLLQAVFVLAALSVIGSGALWLRGLPR